MFKYLTIKHEYCIGKKCLFNTLWQKSHVHISKFITQGESTDLLNLSFAQFVNLSDLLNLRILSLVSQQIHFLTFQIKKIQRYL